MSPNARCKADLAAVVAAIAAGRTVASACRQAGLSPAAFYRALCRDAAARQDYRRAQAAGRAGRRRRRLAASADRSYAWRKRRRLAKTLTAIHPAAGEHQPAVHLDSLSPEAQAAIINEAERRTRPPRRVMRENCVRAI